MTTGTQPVNVVDALAQVMAEMPAIGKDSRASQQQGGYAYRGIEQIAAQAAPLLAKHRVVFVPQVRSCEIRDITVNNKPWTDTILTVSYQICGPGGADDRIEATVVGIGRDNADKGANKALTQAFKYALIQVLCIADSKDDGDGQTHEADARSAAPSYDPMDGWSARAEALNAHAELSQRIQMLDDTQRDVVKRRCHTWPLNAADFTTVEKIVAEFEATREPAMAGAPAWPDGEEPF